VGVLSGESHLSFSPVSTSLAHMKSGKLRMLGVSSSHRLTALPKIPAIAETVPGYEFGGWQAIFTPAGTSQEIIARLHGGTLKAIGTQDFKAYLFREGSDLVGSTPPELESFLRADMEKNRELIKSAGIKLQ